MKTALAITLCALAVFAVGSEAAGPKIGGGDPIDRPSAWTGFWCDCPRFATPPISFIADGPMITVTFDAKNRKSYDGSWTRSAIDNVIVVERSVYDTYLQLITTDHERFYCRPFSGDYTMFFYDDVPAPEYLDQFHSGADANTWDLTDGAYWLSTSSAPNDVATHDDDTPPAPTGGSLGLGEESNLQDQVTTRVEIGGLTQGVEYVLGLWWTTRGDIDPDTVQPVGGPDLVIEIFGTDPTPIRSVSWSAIKGRTGGD